MNTPEPYERRIDRTLPDPDAASTPEAEGVDALAVHRDPSVPTSEAKQEADRSQPSVAWVRPSEMPTLLGSKFVRRGIDLQAELTRHARRTPGVAVSKASRRITRTSIARPDNTSPAITDLEGLGL